VKSRGGARRAAARLDVGEQLLGVADAREHVGDADDPPRVDLGRRALAERAL
jgi:hypothetical protein